jgi:pyrimidine 5'-nucleotidase
MAELIDRYFATHLSLPWDDAVRLHKEYYQNYGLAIEGLVRHHQIDPLDYNTKVDDSLELDGIIKPRPELKQLLADIDTSKVKLWLLTNAYINHAKRVIQLLDVEEYFEGVTYCDYSSVPLTCKPHPDMYHKAMKEAGVDRYEDCFFVGKTAHSAALCLMLTSCAFRRFVRKLQECARVGLDNSTPGGGRSCSTQDSSLEVSNTAPGGVAVHLPSILYVGFQVDSG